ncbi:hypothetical protein PV10_00941 [Exophiala mesophila]|uniref:Zn(2)-C6 fungal-type domain-containing protein n=1 Tax=Exophiala mesophila TaxID=212818 RepID=A0A0D1ZTA9_EXOME|nr:uncharacterized protein PV10_00941 [Exophiala mesophila]KIV97159.1 hypothetical protein PV10_00941 [Exophiala mesophila]
MEMRSPSTSSQVEERHAIHRASKKIRACTPCRQQKLRCDALTSGSKSCSRCALNDISCYFSTNFERKKARSKADLQREIDLLRHQVRPPTMSEHASEKSSASGLQMGMQAVQDTVAHVGTAQREESLDLTVGSTPGSSRAAHEARSTHQSSSTTTATRALDGIYVEAFKINDCFTLFFRHYHRTLPILDPSWDPDTVYLLSPFVFWCVVITGSRRYDLDPTILHRLAPGVTQMALLQLSQFQSYFPTICGLVMLCVWPLPMKTVHDDPSLLYSGIAMQMALQHGLHLFPQSQAYGCPVPYRSATREASLARVWAYVEFVCHCTSWTSGTPPHFFANALDYASWTEDMAQLTSPSIRWMQKFETLCTRATIALSEATLAVGTEPCRGGMLWSLIKLFDEQILDISQKARDDIAAKASENIDKVSTGPAMYPNSMITTMSRVYINSYHFLGTDPALHYAGLVGLFHLACQWAEQATTLDQATDWALYSSESYFRHIALAAAIILRISHSPQFKSTVDFAAGERAYFAAIRILKRRSLHTGDVNAQVAQRLTELWHKDDCFKNSDGSYDSLNVRTRSRGVMGIVYDCVWPTSRDQQESSSVGALNHPPPTRPSMSQDGGVEAVEQSLFEMSEPVDKEILDFMDGSSLDLLYNNFQWTQDDGFWT